jgi:hypothetical protein
VGVFQTIDSGLRYGLGLKDKVCWWQHRAGLGYGSPRGSLEGTIVSISSRTGKNIEEAAEKLPEIRMRCFHRFWMSPIPIRSSSGYTFLKELGSIDGLVVNGGGPLRALSITG